LKSWSSALVAASALVAGVVIAANHPQSPPLALLGFAAWALAAWRWPQAWLWAVPALLPAAGLAPWTGWQMVDEFDLLLLATLAAGHARLAHDGAAAWPRTALALLAVAVLGFVRGWLDAGGAALGWFDSYPDAGNSLRVARGVAYAALCAPLLAQAVDRDAAGCLRRWRSGLLAGLAIVTSVACYERAAYPGLFDFVQIYRTTALFWEMHVGGAAIDAYLALAIPCVAWALHEARSRRAWTLWALFALAVAYAALTTFSRGLYGAALVSLLACAALMWRHDSLRWASRLLAAVAGGLVYTALLAVAHAQWGYGAFVLALLMSIGLALWLRRPGWGWRRVAALGLTAVLLAEAVAVVGPDSFMRERFAARDPDLTSRWRHWQAALDLLDEPAKVLLGVGLGRAPAQYAASSRTHEWPGRARWQAARSADEPARLELAGPTSRGVLGGHFAITQRVALQAGGPWRLQLSARAAQPAQLRVELCERHLLYDGACQIVWLRWPATGSRWHSVGVPLGGPALADAAGRGGVLALSVATPARSVELSRVELRAPDGRQVLHNPDFSRQLAHWLPAAQEYFLPWHVDNLYLDWLVETGLLGLLLFALLVGGAVRGLSKAQAAGAAEVRRAVPFFTASLFAVLLVGGVSSIIDVPRVAFLLLAGLLLAARLGAATARAATGGELIDTVGSDRRAH
jgi:hypothetical protein